MECKAIGPVCCVMRVKEPSTILVKRRGSPRYLLVWLAADCTRKHLVNHYIMLCKYMGLIFRTYSSKYIVEKTKACFEAPSGVIKSLYKNCVLLLLLLSAHVWAYLCCYSLWYSAVDWKKWQEQIIPLTLGNILQGVWVNHLKHVHYTGCVIGTTMHIIYPCPF